QELHVTQGAVSQQVAKLETYLGVQLFERAPRGLKLTEHGSRYNAWVADGIKSLEEATAAIRTQPAGKHISVSTLNSFAAQWLMPRLPSFQTTHPEVQLSIETTLTPVDLAERNLDCAIRRGPGRWHGLTSEFLFRDVLFPVATPDYAATLDLSRGETILETAPLLHDPGDPTEWSRWLIAAGCSGTRMNFAHSFTDTLVLLSAMAGGTEGVALINSALVENELADGRLVRLFETTVPLEHPYYLVYPEARSLSPAMHAFRSWLLEEAKSV
ncbi:MAG: LysR substrate-binding domain-containing protein, partial [Gammaproteobacteria bacterium]|nr:LysR substrate-binding domain-containing protein [Gammaproteobacteria bacterium]